MDLEFPLQDKSIFYDGNNNIIDHKNFQLDKQTDIFTFISSDSSVLELGSDYGIISCLINSILKNPNNHVVMESDIDMIKIITKNRNNNGSKFKINEKSLLEFNTLIINHESLVIPFFEKNSISGFRCIILPQNISSEIKNDLHNHGFICVKDTVFINTSTLPFDVIEFQVGHGYIGFFGKLGHISKLDGNFISDIVLDKKDILTISTHAPSTLILNVKKEILIQGYCSTTSRQPSNLVFRCDDDIVGNVNKSGEITNYYTITPGRHKLTIETDNLCWAHSVWLITPIKYFKINIDHIGRGLMNQLINIINGILISNNVSRYIYNPTFLPYYNSTDSIPLSEVIDIDYLNELLETFGLKVRIEKELSLENEKWIKSDNYNNVCSVNSMTSINQSLVKMEYPYMDIGCMFSVTLEKDMTTLAIEHQIYKNLKFMPKYYQVVEYCINTYLSPTFNSVHLRMEDDFALCYASTSGKSFKEYSNIILKRYLQYMKTLFKTNSPIYIATHLLKSENRNNYIIDEIRKVYPNIVIATPWRDKFSLPIGREIDAIIDYILCLRSHNFIGMAGSTYSVLISKILTSNGKGSSLVFPQL